MFLYVRYVKQLVFFGNQGQSCFFYSGKSYVISGLSLDLHNSREVIKAAILNQQIKKPAVRRERKKRDIPHGHFEYKLKQIFFL